jgi:hypothetical protein
MRGECRGLRYGDLALGGRCERGCEAAADARGGQQKSLVVEIIVESCSCGPASTMGGRICASVVAAGPRPALGEVVAASSRHSNRGHDVSILMAMIGPQLRNPSSGAAFAEIFGAQPEDGE